MAHWRGAKGVKGILHDPTPLWWPSHAPVRALVVGRALQVALHAPPHQLHQLALQLRQDLRTQAGARHPRQPLTRNAVIRCENPCLERTLLYSSISPDIACKARIQTYLAGTEQDTKTVPAAAACLASHAKPGAARVREEVISTHRQDTGAPRRCAPGRACRAPRAGRARPRAA